MATDSTVFETDDKNLAALLRVQGMTQTGRRPEDTGDPARPHFYFQFESKDGRCDEIKDLALLGSIEVNYRRFLAEQMAVMDQIFEHKRRVIGDGELPPFLHRRTQRR